MRRRIYVDLDNTLIDSVRRYQDEFRVAEHYGISSEEYKAAAEELYAKQGNRVVYSFDLLFPVLQKRNLGLSSGMLQDLERLFEQTYFFSDTEEFLAGFLPEEMLILTEGVRDFQLDKVYAHKLEKRVGQVIVIDAGNSKAGAISAGSIPTFFIDDAPRHIAAVKQVHPSVFCIQVRMLAPWEHVGEHIGADICCPTLREAAEYIRQHS